MKKIFFYALLIVLTNTFTGCSYAVYNVTQPIDSFSPTHMQVRSAIVDAANKTAWNIIKDSDSKLLLKYIQPRYEATIAIQYSTSSYDIDYISSKNLNYSNATIHKTYNKIIKRLHQEIRANLQKVKMGETLVGDVNISNTKTPEKGIESKLMQLKSLHDKGLISDSEYSSKKDELLKSFIQ